MEMCVADGRARLCLLEHGLVGVLWVSGTGMRSADIKDVLARSFVLADSVPFAVLMDLRDINSLSIGARKALAQNPSILACAMFGSTAMDRVLAASAEHTAHPVRFFTERPDALAWLRGHIPVPDHIRP